MNIEKVRSEFPHLNTDQIYFDHAAVSPLCNRSRYNIEKYIHNVQNYKINNFEDTLNLAEKIRNDFSTLIGSTQNRVAVVKNTTDGLILLARGLQWKKGDRIILYEKEFPSNIYPWYDLKHLGVKIDFINTPLGNIDLENLEKVVNNKTRLLSISWVQYSSGYKNDLKKLANWCHERGILFVVDAMQGLGAMSLDVNETGIDFLSTGTAKWLLGPHGIGFIYLSKQLQDIINPPHLGWLSRADMLRFHDYEQPLKSDASRYEFATPFSLGIWAYAGAIELMLEIGKTKIEKRILQLTDRLVEGIKSIGFEVISDRISLNTKSGIVIASHVNKKNNERILEKLNNKKVHISMRNNNLRISPHFYNTEAEIDRFITILDSTTA